MSTGKRNVATTDQDISPPARKRPATTSRTAVANFFTPVSQKKASPAASTAATVTFETVDDSILVGRFAGATTTTRPRPLRVAAFDFDDTLVTTQSGLRFARGADDWKWWHASVPGRLRQLHADGYAVVAISNQSRVVLRPDAKRAGDMKSLANFKAKVTAVLEALALPVSIYAATQKDLHRKPRTGMWTRVCADYGVEEGGIDLDGCVFVGDAAGRPADPATQRKKDHSCSDRDFAANVGIPFQTPEEYFRGEAPRPFVRPFDPAPFLSHPDDPSPIVFAKTNPVDLVLFCGSPGAGKSTFYWRHLQPLGYERVNQDTLKTRDRCIKVATQLVEQQGSAVVVDNTNADRETRAVWVQLARRLNVPVRLVHFTAPATLCEHNATLRALSDGLMNPENRSPLPGMAFTGYATRYREPSMDEGFQDITQVDFHFSGTDDEKALWGRYWI